MVEFGCCLSVASFVPQVRKVERACADMLKELEDGISMLSQNSFDFVELTVGSLASLSDHDFQLARDIINNANIPVLAFNSFVPANLRLTGPDVSYREIDEYIALVMDRVNQVGGRHIVFGSGAARGIPNGFRLDAAREQIIRFLEVCNKYADRYAIVVAIEPLNRLETNMINTLQEAVALAKTVDLPQIKVLADSYHMYMEKESFDALYEAAPYLTHVHLSDKDRCYPGQSVEDGVDFDMLFDILRSIGYRGGMSLECTFSELARDTKGALSFIRGKWYA
jgi:D-psicose/D-tagatose/L-ribulose 3-epimerase